MNLGIVQKSEDDTPNQASNDKMSEANTQYAIKIKNLSKKYRMYKGDAKRALGMLGLKVPHTEFVALDKLTVNFEKGEVTAILGRNGSGKSTLLKLISGVAHPDSGTIVWDGRVSALLELKSGFNKELTGIENIRFKALTMGIPKAEIEDVIEDIIEFADLGEHINEPFRTYSSGMKARLGFAVAVSINPDILIVDEALSVGDSVFKMKCINKMNEFREQGKTILFVSHSMNTVKAFCTRAIWLNKGKLMAAGDLEDVVVKYSEFLKEQRALLKKDREEKHEDSDQPLTKYDIVRPYGFKLINSEKETVKAVKFDDNWGFEFKYEVKENVPMLNLAFTVFNSEDVEVYSSDKSSTELDVSLGKHKVRVMFDGAELMPGTYYVTVDIWDSFSGMKVSVTRLAALDITLTCYEGTGIAHLPHKVTQRKRADNDSQKLVNDNFV